MTKRALWLAAAVTAVIPFAAQAGDAGWYVGAGGGASLTEDSDISTGESVESDIGFIGLLRGGYDYGNGWRTELEASYRDGGVDKVNGANGDGNIDSISGMINALYEFETGSFFRPYLGVGVGGSYVGFDKVRPINSSVIDENDMVFAYQGIAGISFEVNPNVAVFVDYRYLGTDDPDLSTNNNTEIEGEYSNHSVLAGVRYKWLKPKPAPEPVPEIVRAKEEPPPPPPAPPAEDIPRNFIIFFDWDQDVITPEALKILQEAAQYAQQANVARVVLTGHADRSGSDQYNEGLSMRRARNAMSELVGLGIAETAIAVFAKGEAQPLVATDDGVREPQNRRVEIVLE